MKIELNSKVHQMQVERDPLNLGNLPSLDPPADGWPVVEAALIEHSEKKRIWRSTAASLALVATIVLVMGLTLRHPRLTELAPETPGLAQQAAPDAAPAGDEPAVESLIALSQRLEVQLRRIRSDAPLMSASSVVYQVELQDLVAQVDEELSVEPDSAELWGQRVNLLLDLPRLYRNELRRESARIASL